MERFESTDGVVWQPTAEHIAHSHLHAFMGRHGLNSLEELQDRSTRDIAWFWEAVLQDLLATDPQTHGHQATGWTVPLLQGELAQVGYAVGGRTVHRALHRLGYEHGDCFRAFAEDRFFELVGSRDASE